MDSDSYHVLILHTPQPDDPVGHLSIVDAPGFPEALEACERLRGQGCHVVVTRNACAGSTFYDIYLPAGQWRQVRATELLEVHPNGRIT